VYEKYSSVCFLPCSALLLFIKKLLL
jgi:hypothetical protein